MRVKMDSRVYRLVLARLALQFDPVVALNVLPSPRGFLVDYSKRGVPRHVFRGDRYYLTIRPSDGMVSLSIEAGEAVVKSSDYPRYRVVVKGIPEGSVFVSDVIDIDEALRPGDEVVVVDDEGVVVGTGRLKIPPAMIKGLNRGEVVRVRRRRG